MRENKHRIISLAAVVLVLSLCGCSVKKEAPKTIAEPAKTEASVQQSPTQSPTVQEPEPTKESKATKVPAVTKQPQKTKQPEKSKQPEKTKKPSNKKKVNGSKVIVIDPGHQSKQNSDVEALAPGSKETKKRTSSGTQGRFTKVPEYEVTLSVSKQLKTSLEKLGYKVILTRETNEVDISNIQRAKIANNAKADAFIRIHCDGVDNEKVNGASALCPTKNSPYCKSIYNDSYALSKAVLSELVKRTGAKERGITKTDKMVGINWSKVPVTILEMGYMTNKVEDEKLVSKKYQKLLVEGITNGIVKYLEDK